MIHLIWVCSKDVFNLKWMRLFSHLKMCLSLHPRPRSDSVYDTLFHCHSMCHTFFWICFTEFSTTFRCLDVKRWKWASGWEYWWRSTFSVAQSFVPALNADADENSLACNGRWSGPNPSCSHIITKHISRVCGTMGRSSSSSLIVFCVSVNIFQCILALHRIHKAAVLSHSGLHCFLLSHIFFNFCNTADDKCVFSLLLLVGEIVKTSFQKKSEWEVRDCETTHSDKNAGIHKWLMNHPSFPLSPDANLPSQWWHASSRHLGTVPVRRGDTQGKGKASSGSFPTQLV